jgi:exodeoxyribonuclease V beta subunit
VARSFRVALIDEFQDTDPIQYDIFRTALPCSSARCFWWATPSRPFTASGGGHLCLSGCAAAMPRRPAILAGYQPPFRRRWWHTVNQLFSRAGHFLLDEIAYQPVHAAPSSGAVLEVDDDDAAFTVLWQAPEATSR